MRSGGRRGYAVVVLLGVLGVLGVAACGDQDSPGVAQEPTPPETPTPPYEPPELDRTELDANLASLSPEDRALVDHYLHANGEEGTWIVAAPLTVTEAKERLLGPGAQPVTAADQDAATDFTTSAYAFLQVGDGVVAWEDTGFADPPKRLLAALSEGGAVSAVATDNIEAMTRFGYARDGQIVFDAFEYAFVDSLDEIPAEVRDLARLAWSDPASPMAELASWSAVAQAMSEKVTGVRATPPCRTSTSGTPCRCRGPLRRTTDAHPDGHREAPSWPCGPHLGLVLTSGRSPSPGSVRSPSS
ncbi:DUF6461 domain-containing protein [Nocardioides sp. GCM10028917]|uniref:DUF6461 domain-containing protein n=1 Tax=Nocardioides sp. GCM10028917 TaxID=3273408 RepID=UPI00361D4769